MVHKTGFSAILIIIALLWRAPAYPAESSSGQILGGSTRSPIQIEVFSDFQCSACREFYLSTIRQVLQEYSSKDQVCVTYHEFPLTSHKYSLDAARYSEAAARLGVQKHRSVMDALFMDQAQWSQDGKIEASISKVLSREDIQALKNILKDSSINLAVEKEIQLGVKNKITSTPTMIIHYAGKQQRAEGFLPYIVLKQFIDSIFK